MSYSTLEIDMEGEIKKYFVKKMKTHMEANCNDPASMSIFLEAYDDDRAISDAATCLGHAILNSMIVDVITHGLLATRNVTREDR